ETTDYARPIVFAAQVGLQDPDQGPVLDDSWPAIVKTELPFWNGCDEDDRCLPDLSLQSTNDLMTRKQFCARPVQSRGVFCRHQGGAGAEGSLRVIEGNKRRMVVDVKLENRGENAYNTLVNITYTPNLRFSSLIVKDTSEIKIECNTDMKRNEKICNVSAPFMRAKSQVLFRLEFEFSRTIFLKHLRVLLEASSDGDEVNTADNFNEIYYSLKYEGDILFTRDSIPTRYEIKSELSLEEPGVIGPPFNFTFQ
ncbi:hypothetical protein ILYODFUR_021319, partial [Ilyodon furcidens]